MVRNISDACSHYVLYNAIRALRGTRTAKWNPCAKNSAYYYHIIIIQWNLCVKYSLFLTSERVEALYRAVLAI